MGTSNHLVFILSLAIVVSINCQEVARSSKRKVPFVQQFIRGKDGSYGWSYFTIDGKTHYETRDSKGTVRGRYTYYSPLGQKVAVNYIADEKGFRVLPGFQPGPPDESPQVINQQSLIFV